jgi:hypothetical protein
MLALIAGSAVVLGAAAADGLAGDCGTHAFALADCTQQAGTMTCE